MKLNLITVILSVVLLASGDNYTAVRHDTTLTGEGITISPLKVDTTTFIATQYDLTVYVDKSNTQTVGGVKTFSSDPLIPDEAYGVTFDGQLVPVTKNSLYDARLTETNYIKAARALGSSIAFKTVGNDNINNAFTLTDNTARYHAVYIDRAATITGVKWYQAVTGSYTADQNNYVALYSYSGGTMTQVAISANDGNIWKATVNTVASAAFTTPYAAVPGIYFVGSLWNASATTTSPQLGSAGNLQAAGVTSMDFTNSAKMMGSVATQNSLPGTQAMTGVTGVATAVWFGLY